tara:strand:+ start:338 stop:724 length:387 start_codon:yes stop_codon:yes gene_type:complete
MVKRCTACSEDLDESMFWIRTYASGKKGLQTKCKVCSTKGRRKYYKPHHLIRDMLKISDEEYEGLMVNTNCNICGKKLDKKCIDHCHETKKIRGVLCNNCNTALGLFKDNVEVMQTAIQYLERAEQLH